MKILWLSHPESDHSAYFLYNGLRQLGVEIIDFPYKHMYHGESHSYPTPWYAKDSVGFSSPLAFYVKWDGVKYSEQEILKMLREFDLVVVESPRAIPLQSLKKLENESSLPPIVIVDGEDYDNLALHVIDRFDVALYFKRELVFKVNDVYPLPFSSYIIGESRYDFDDSEKELDVFFVAGNTYPDREVVSRLLKGIVKKHGFKAVIGLAPEPVVDETPVVAGNPLVNGLSGLSSARFRAWVHAPKKDGLRFRLEEYLESIAKSKVSVSVRGWGRDTMRFWEIPSYHTLLFSDDLREYGLIHPYPFTHQKNAVFFKPNCSDLEELLVYYLENDSKRKKIAEAGHKHLCKYHTNKARAEFFLTKVKEHIPEVA